MNNMVYLVMSRHTRHTHNQMEIKEIKSIYRCETQPIATEKECSVFCAALLYSTLSSSSTEESNNGNNNQNPSGSFDFGSSDGWVKTTIGYIWLLVLFYMLNRQRKPLWHKVTGIQHTNRQKLCGDCDSGCWARVQFCLSRCANNGTTWDTLVAYRS